MMRWLQHVARIGRIRNLYRLLTGKSQEEKPPGRCEVRNLSQLNPAHALTPCLFKIRFIVILPPTPVFVEGCLN